MNGDSVSGSTLDLAKNPSTYGDAFGWVFQQLRIAFRDLASGVGPGIPSDHGLKRNALQFIALGA